MQVWMQLERREKDVASSSSPSSEVALAHEDRKKGKKGKKGKSKKNEHQPRVLLSLSPSLTSSYLRLARLMLLMSKEH